MKIYQTELAKRLGVPVDEALFEYEHRQSWDRDRILFGFTKPVKLRLFEYRCPSESVHGFAERVLNGAAINMARWDRTGKSYE